MFSDEFWAVVEPILPSSNGRPGHPWTDHRHAPATLTRRVASINQVNTAAGLDPPRRNEIVRRALSGIRRIRATPPNRRAPLLLADIRTLMISIAETAPAGGGRGGTWRCC